MSNVRKRKRDEPVVQSSDSEDEVDWENLSLDQITPAIQEEPTSEARPDIVVSLSADVPTQVSRRVSTNAIARKIRLEIHKLHLLCLISHVSLRNKWLQHDRIQASLQALRRSFNGNVHPKPTSAQMQRTRVLLEGLHSACDFWSSKFKVTMPGLSKPKWYADDDLHKVVKIDAQKNQQSFDDFCEAAQSLCGDRDTGAQLFCAFLRSLGLDVRLICSLQPLALRLSKENIATFHEEALQEPQPTEPAYNSGEVSKQPRSLSRPSLKIVRRPVAAMPKPMLVLAAPIGESAWPIYWVEVFDPAAQKWYSLDPLVTNTINKPAALEPPRSEAENNLAYVLAFQKEGHMRDVTLRYTKHFNAKVRKDRVDSLHSGASWWLNVMKLYRRRPSSDRDLIEDSELSQKQLSEGIPANVADLKGHPIFVIERHLHKDEIILPLRECGSITIGKSRPAIVEKVYPRKFVVKLKSSFGWYMRGRVIKAGEQPLKSIEKTSTSDDREDSHVDREGLFSESQTAIFVPSPVATGKVPKNNYGNIDIFVPSMIPSGGTHYPFQDGERIAKLLDIDYAIAITGFEHAHRMTVPIKQGVVIAEEYVEVMQALHQAYLEEAAESSRRATSLQALRNWGLLLRKFRIRMHVEEHYS